MDQLDFSNLGIEEPILNALKEMNFIKPTEVQKEAIPHILEGKDLIVMAKTGSGKTGAFGIPILQSIPKDVRGIKALILTPTRELAIQVNEDIRKMAKYLSLQTAVVYGQHDINVEIDDLNSGVNIVTGTPGRVIDHLRRKTLITKNIEFLVIDEADRMLDMGFIQQVVDIIHELPTKRVTLLFSATMPQDIRRICTSYMNEPITIEMNSDTKTVDTVEQVYYRVQPSEKREQLERLLIVEHPVSCMVFCNTRDEVDRVQNYLYKKGYSAGALHGANNQNRRMKTIKKFKEGELSILVATDVAARGIHVEDLPLVINYDIPNDKDNYVHRIGRTARAGKSGKAISLATGEDIMSLYAIEEHVGVLIEELELPSDEEVKACEEDAKVLKRSESSILLEQLHYKPKVKVKEFTSKNSKHSQTNKKKAEDKQTNREEIKSQSNELSNIKKEDNQNIKTKQKTKPRKNGREATIMVKNLGPVKVIYRDEPKESKLSKFFKKLFKRDKEA